MWKIFILIILFLISHYFIISILGYIFDIVMEKEIIKEFERKDWKFMKEVKLGDLVILKEMDDFQSPPAGTRGIVRHIDDAKQIHVDWENGSSLALISELDKFDIIDTKYLISENHLEIFKSNFLYGKIPLKDVIDIYNINKDFFATIWSVAKKNHISPVKFYNADYICYNNSDKTLKVLLPEVIKVLENKNVNRWFAYPESKHIEWIYYNHQNNEYYRMKFDSREIQTEIYICEKSTDLFFLLKWAVLSKSTIIYDKTNLIDGYNAIRCNNYAITEISEKNTDDTYKSIVYSLVQQGYRFLVTLTNDAFEYTFIIYDILKKEYAEKENGEYYLFNDKKVAIKCCEKLNKTGVK